MCRRNLHNWNLVVCDVKQPISLTHSLGLVIGAYSLKEVARRGGAEVAAGWTLDRRLLVRFSAYPHRVGALWLQGGKRRLRTSRCPCRGRLGMLKAPSFPWRWVPGSRSKFENWTSVPSLYSWNIAECDVKPQSTTTTTKRGLFSKSDICVLLNELLFLGVRRWDIWTRKEFHLVEYCHSNWTSQISRKSLRIILLDVCYCNFETRTILWLFCQYGTLRIMTLSVKFSSLFSYV